MKAMLYADCMSLRQTMKSMVFMMVVFVVAGFLFTGPMFFCMLVPMISIMFPLTLLSSDKAYGWDQLSLSMPILRRDVIGSKFVLTLGVCAAMTVLAGAFGTVYNMVMPAADIEMSGMEMLSALLACAAVSLVFAGVILIVACKWGVERARYIMMACIYIPVILAFVYSKLGLPRPDLGGVGTYLQALDGWRAIGFFALAIAAACVVYVICWALSVRVFSKKEF